MIVSLVSAQILMGGCLNLDGGTLNLNGGTLTLDGGTRPPAFPLQLKYWFQAAEALQLLCTIATAYAVLLQLVTIILI